MKLGTTLYVVRKKLDLTKEEKQVRYCAVPVTSGQIDIHELAATICERCSLTRADVLATVSALSDVMQQRLRDGHTVKLDGIGIFSVSASSEAMERREQCTPSKVKAKRVCFKADKEMRLILNEIEYVNRDRFNTKKKTGNEDNTTQE